MHTYDKSSNDKVQQSAEPIQQKAEDNADSVYADNRPETLQLKELQGVIANSKQSQQAIQMHSMMNQGSENNSGTIQFHANNTGLSNQLKSGIENLSGYSMNDVKVHYNSPKPAQLNAHAYAQGTQIHVAPGQEKHVPHEAWHVVQQKQGRVQATKQLKGEIAINDDKGLEHEADVMGAKAMQLKTIEGKDFAVGQTPVKPVIQGAFTRSMRNLIDEAGSKEELIIMLNKTTYNVSKKQEILNEYLGLNNLSSDDIVEEDQDDGFGEEATADYVLNTTAHGGDVYERDIDYNSDSYQKNASPEGVEMEEETAQFKIIQLARKGNVMDGPKDITTSTTIPDFEDSFYIREGDGNINFTVSPTKTRYNNYSQKKKALKHSAIKWTDPQDSNSIIDLSNHPKASTIDTKDRPQHFGMADYLYSKKKGWKKSNGNPNASKSKNHRGGTWTWHHLSTQYKMVLVDMNVHAQHAHNGGVHVW